MKRVCVLGAGAVGRVIAADLAADASLRVRAADRSGEALAALRARAEVETLRTDLSDPAEIERATADAHVVVAAVPGFMGGAVLRRVLELGRSVVDISFASEDPLALDALARKRGAVAVVDCGVAPGLSNLLVGRASAELDAIDEARILVGGLPVRRVWPWEYRAPFSPTDVIEEYTRPCRMRLNGEEIVRPALSDPELVDLPGAGTLEAFNTDGLRTLLRTIPARTLVEKTLRYPGHAEKMRMLRESGFLDATPVRIGAVEIAPRALAEHLLFAAWKLDEGEEEFTLLRVEAAGSRGGVRTRIVWDLLDRTDAATGTTSMSRTTGFPCAIVARLLLEGAWPAPGVHPPEVLGRDEAIFRRILEALRSRGVRIERWEPEAARP